MFKSVFKLCDNIINIDIQNIVINVFFNDEVRKFTLNLNRVEQLFKEGIDSKGKVVGEYTGCTEERRKGLTFSYEGWDSEKLQGKNYTLYDTGKFYKSFDVIVYKDGFTIEADPLKEDGTDLTRKFRRDILGLTDKSKSELIDKILPLIIKEIRKQIFK